MRLLVTRPAADAVLLVARLSAMGHQVQAAPLMDIVYRTVPLDLAVQALLITSRNGLRAFARLTPRRDLPVFAVGASSADAAHAEGFATVLSADGDVEALAALVRGHLKPAGGALLHPAGTEIAGNLQGALPDFEVRRAVAYEARALSRLPAEAGRFLKADGAGGVLFYSPRTARLFTALTEKEGLTARLGSLTAFCLSPAVASAARGFGRVQTSTAPHEAALLGLIPLEPGGNPS